MLESHVLIVLSLEALAMLPFGKTATECTLSVCPVNVLFKVMFVKSQSLRVLSQEPLTTILTPLTPLTPFNKIKKIHFIFEHDYLNETCAAFFLQSGQILKIEYKINKCFSMLILIFDKLI